MRVRHLSKEYSESAEAVVEERILLPVEASCRWERVVLFGGEGVWREKRREIFEKKNRGKARGGRESFPFWEEAKDRGV